METLAGITKILLPSETVISLLAIYENVYCSTISNSKRKASDLITQTEILHEYL